MLFEFPLNFISLQILFTALCIFFEIVYAISLLIFFLKKVKKRIVKAYIIGKNILFFKKQIGKSVPFSVSNNMQNAVNNIYKDLKLDDNSKSTILLSPAAASYDQFNNFEYRGNYFKNLIIKKFKRRLNV